ncbi:hypothetical protein BH11MYX2_BH11MYX2_36420 [soil metagenome]
MHLRETGASEGGLDGPRTNTVERRVREQEAAPIDLGLCAQRDDIGDVPIVHRFIEIHHEAARAKRIELGHHQPIAATDLGGRGRDADIVRRNDLRAVAPVDLVTVVRGRVVARGDHDACAGLRVGDRPRRGWRRPFAMREERLDTEAAEHAGRVLRERARVATRIVRDGDAARLRVGHVLDQIRGEARRHLADEHAVHPLRAGAEDASEACGAELERAREPFGHVADRGFVALVDAGQELRELGDGGGIRILREPGAGEDYCVVHRGQRYPATY